MTLALYVEDERQQRAGLFLRDVAYRLHAELDVRSGEPRQKYDEMFLRRRAKGQWVNQPYLGCREFARQRAPGRARLRTACPSPRPRDLGWMLHDLDFTHLAPSAALLPRADAGRRHPRCPLSGEEAAA